MNEFPNWFVTMQANFEEWLPKDKPLRVLQIGTYKGDATRWLLDNREIEIVHDVDTWEGSDEHEGWDFSEVEKLYDDLIAGDPRVVKFKMTSNQYFAENNQEFDFIYVDGDHTAVQTALDGIHAMQRLVPGGIIAFDDYLWTYKGPMTEPRLGIEAVLHLFQHTLDRAMQNYQIWAWRKTA